MSLKAYHQSHNWGRPRRAWGREDRGRTSWPSSESVVVPEHRCGNSDRSGASRSLYPQADGKGDTRGQPLGFVSGKKNIIDK